MRVVFMIPKLSYSGAPKMLAWISNQMACRNHDVHIVAFFSNEQSQELHKNITFHNIEEERSSNWLMRNTIGMIKVQRQLHKKINCINPDVIVSFQNSVGYIYLVVNALCGKRKIIFSERADPSAYKGIIAKIRFALMNLANGLVFQTEGARDFFDGKYDKKSVVIPNPVVIKDCVKKNYGKYMNSYEERDNRVVTVGRLSIIQKRQDLLLEAFSGVLMKHPEMELVIYGDGPDKEEIIEISEKLGIRNHVQLAGRIDNVEENIYSARVFALSSDFEGIPNALIEAMSIGVPCVSTDCSPGGAALLIKDGENGFLVPRNDVNALAEKINCLIEDENFSNTFSANGPKIKNTFSEEKIASMWEEYLNQIRGENK